MPLCVPVCPENYPHWKLRTYTKRPIQYVFLNELDICRRNVGTSWHCEYHDDLSLSVLCVLWLIHICTWIYFLNAIEVAWENHCAWGVVTNVPKARTEEQSRPVLRWAASSTPELYPLMPRDTGTAGYPRPLGSPAREAWFAGTSALGAVDDKTMHGFVMKLSMDLIFHKFQANNRTPQCVSVVNTVLCTQSRALIFIHYGQIIILGITKYYY